MSAPAVSVVVAARDAAPTLPATLRALAAQDLGETYEVLVVDNASRDETAAVAGSAGVRVLRNPRDLGVAASRNRGAAAAAAPLLAFTDADCEPVPGWLAAGLAALRGGADLAQGAVAPPPGVSVGPWDRTLRVQGAGGLFETASLFVTRAAFERAGGFPEARPAGPGPWPRAGEAPFGEDARFGRRVRTLGGRVVFVPDALVHHAVFPRTRTAFVRERRRLRYFPTLAREVPLGRFLSARTRAFDAALAGVLAAAATRRPAPLLAALPYALAARPRRGRGHPLADAVVEAAADVVAFASLAEGSLRARRLLL